MATIRPLYRLSLFASCAASPVSARSTLRRSCLRQGNGQQLTRVRTAVECNRPGAQNCRDGKETRTNEARPLGHLQACSQADTQMTYDPIDRSWWPRCIECREPHLDLAHGHCPKCCMRDFRRRYVASRFHRLGVTRSIGRKYAGNERTAQRARSAPSAAGQRPFSSAARR
jgi:hypothetical protein